MGHALFIVLHLAALLFGFWGLILTVPLHLIYSAMSGPASARSNGEEHDGEHVRCPECRELVRADARKCKHCGVALTPAMQAPTPSPRPPNPAQGYAYMALAALICIVVAARACAS